MANFIYVNNQHSKHLSNYYPGGMLQPGRNFNADSYRYGSASGQEKVDEISGSGNHYTAEFWEYDPRLGRRWNIDPVVKPWESGYATFKNNPIYYTDRKGLDGEGPKNECPGDMNENGQIYGLNGVTGQNEWTNPLSEVDVTDFKMSNKPPALPNDNTTVNMVSPQDNLIQKQVSFWDRLADGFKGNHHFKPMGDSHFNLPFGIKGIDYYTDDGQSNGEKGFRTTGDVERQDYNKVAAFFAILDYTQARSGLPKGDDIIYGQMEFTESPRPPLAYPNSNDLLSRPIDSVKNTLHKMNGQGDSIIWYTRPDGSPIR